MANDVQRVVVFGREGQAREQLISALTDLGVQPVWVGKPSQTTPEALSLLAPDKVAISLEPVTELELEPYSEFLSQPFLTVLFDDAETTGMLSGWDLNRWARHMAAKLLDRDVLPPIPVPAHDETATPAAEALLQLPVDKGQQHAAVVTVYSEAEEPAYWQDNGHYEDLAIDADALALALANVDSALAQSQQTGASVDSEQLLPLTEEEDALLAVDQALPAESALPDEIPHFELDAEALANALQQMDAKVSPKNPDLPDVAVQKLPETSPAPGFDELSLHVEAERPEADAVPSFVAREFDLSMFSLLNEEASPLATAESLPIHETTERVLPASPQDSQDQEALFLVLSGVGGPGAVRNLLLNVPRDFTGVMVLSLQLDVGQLQRLLAQLQKATDADLRVVGHEEYLRSGSIYLLPPGWGIGTSALGLQCQPGVGLEPFIAAQTPSTRILVLSGADVMLAPALKAFSQAHHTLYVQDPEECYDATVVGELMQAGASRLGEELMAKWFSQTE